MTVRRNLLACFTNILLLLSLGPASTAWADTHTAASSSYADVSAAVTAASRGDTVSVPAGSATWSSTLTITKGITLQGAGMDLTTIRRSGNIINWSPDATAQSNHETLKITGFTFDGNGNSTAGMINSSLPGSATNASVVYLVVGNNKFKNSTASAFRTTGSFYGVIYSNTFIDVNIICGIFGTNGVKADGEAQWLKLAREYGTANNLYFEDNTFSYTKNGIPGWTESGQGGRVAFRYNTWNATNTTGEEFWDIHGLQSAPSAESYSTMVAEYYGNMITNVSSYRWLLHRGSWVMVFNNVLAGGSSSPGLSIGEYACDEAAAGPKYSQHVQNTYVWNNTSRGARANLEVEDDYCAARSHSNAGFPAYTITENRDFYNYNVSCTASSCSSGIGAGPATPSGTCTAGVGYWKTNYSTPGTPPAAMADLKAYTQSGTFYKCTATNTWTPYYTPYTYPHPLRAETGTLAAPANLRIP